MDKESMKSILRGSLARGYCSESNKDKVVDPALVESMVECLIKDLTLPEHLEWKPSDRIPASDRVMLATRTEAHISLPLIQRFCEPETLRLLHAGMGLVTEAGEYMDQLKKHLFYGKPLDKINLMEELGDTDWYMNLACDVLHTTMQVIETANIKKLAKRYGDKFSEDAALLRNLGAELEVLKENLPDNPLKNYDCAE